MADSQLPGSPLIEKKEAVVTRRSKDESLLDELGAGLSRIDYWLRQRFIA
jgi:hypothetical protein